MKTLDNFIIERLKLNKDTKIQRGFSEEYCIVVPFNIEWNRFCEKYEQWSTWIHGDYNIYIIPIKDVVKKTTEFKHDNNNREIYKIPDKYNNFEELKIDHENKKFCVCDGNLEKLDI